MSMSGASQVRGPKGRSPHVGRPSQARRQLTVGLLGLLTSAGILAGCGTGVGAPAPTRPNAVLVKTTKPTTPSTTTTTTTPVSTSLPECGSGRDPFDPTGSPPPAGSAAIC